MNAKEILNKMNENWYVFDPAEDAEKHEFDAKDIRNILCSYLLNGNNFDVTVTRAFIDWLPDDIIVKYLNEQPNTKVEEV